MPLTIWRCITRNRMMSGTTFITRKRALRLPTKRPAAHERAFAGEMVVASTGARAVVAGRHPPGENEDGPDPRVTTRHTKGYRRRRLAGAEGRFARICGFDPDSSFR